MEKEYFEDYEVGEVLITPGRTITESDIHAFASLTGDWHPLHTDAEFAANTLFGERIAHGMLVLSIGYALCFRLGQFVALPKSFVAFCSIENVRFAVPVRIGDTIHLEAKVVDMVEKDVQNGVIKTCCRIKNQDDKNCCGFTTKIICGRRIAQATTSVVYNHKQFH